MSRTVDRKEIDARLAADFESGDVAGVFASRKLCREFGWNRKKRAEMDVQLRADFPGMFLLIVLDRREDNIHMLAMDEEGLEFVEFMARELECNIEERLSA